MTYAARRCDSAVRSQAERSRHRRSARSTHRRQRYERRHRGPATCARSIRAAWRRSRGSTSTSAPARCSGCSGPTAPASPRPIGMLTTTIPPTSGTRACWGYDVAREPLAARASSAASSSRSRSSTPGSAAARTWSCMPACGASARRQAQPRIAELIDAFGPGRADRPRRCHLQRRPAPAAGDRPGARLTTPGAVPRRADGRSGFAHPTRVARSDRRPA